MLRRVLLQYHNVISHRRNILNPLSIYFQLLGERKLIEQESLNCHVRQFSTTILFKFRESNPASHSIILSKLSSRKMASSKSDQTSSSSPTQDIPGTTSPSDHQQSKPKFCATKEELKARLSPIQFQVTQLKSTERSGSGEYNKFNKKGSYHCVVCNEELFKSEKKFESGCGWPAFFEAAAENRLKYVRDYSLVGSANLLLLASKADLIRTEVLCANCDAHLGHRFDDGPISKGGKRYCINSAALRFEPCKDSEHN